MSEFIVAYWSGTGNTEAMAQMIGEGIEAAGGWMRSWADRIGDAGAAVIGGEGVICQDAPDGEAKEALTALGKEMTAQ